MGYEVVDLSIMLQLRVAISCHTEYEAEWFLHNCKEQFPEECESWDSTKWAVFGHNTCYTFFDGLTIDRRSLMYGSYDFCLDRKYDIIRFCDLPPKADLVESDQSIDMLM